MNYSFDAFGLAAILAILAFAFVMWIFFSDSAKKWTKTLTQKIKPLRQYGLTTFIFFPLMGLGYVIIWNQTKDPDTLSNVLSVYNTVVALIFAVLAWYFAFRQLQESKIARLESSWNECFMRREHKRGYKYFQELHLIEPSNFNFLANYIELMISTGQVGEFDSKIIELGKLSVEGSEKLIVQYFRTVKHAFDGNMTRYSQEGKQLLELKNSLPNIYGLGGWKIEDLVSNSERFSLLPQALRDSLLEMRAYFIGSKPDSSDFLKSIN